MGLTTRADAPEGKIKNSGVMVAKNYLSQDEMKQENVGIYRVAVYSKEKLALNTLSDDGRLGTLSDMEYADRKDYYTEFCVRFISE